MASPQPPAAPLSDLVDQHEPLRDADTSPDTPNREREDTAKALTTADLAAALPSEETSEAEDEVPPGSIGLPRRLTEESLPVPSPSTSGTQSTRSIPSVPGKRSHPTSPLPRETLEYFNETASRMGSRAASGMLVQSADGKSAGIFFRPGDHSRTQSGTTYPRHATTSAELDSDQSSDDSESSAPTHWPASTSAGTDHQLRALSPVPVHSELSTSRQARSPSIGQASGRPYPSGSLFSPEVGIDAVLSGSAPPLATPLSPPSRQSGSSQDMWDGPPTHPGQAAVIAAAGTPSTRSPQQSANATPIESATPPPPSPGESPAPKRLDLPPEDPTGTLHTAEASNENPLHRPDLQRSTLTVNSLPATQSRHGRLFHPSSVTMTPQQSARSAKPSALPQPGLLIGAGFAAKGKKNSVPKKALVREPVLPPIKVLIVEDNPINQRIMAKFMDQKKIKYEIATNGRDAIDRWQSGGFHLILMDIQLPVMDGIEATREIRRLERSANIGILPSTPPQQTPASRHNIDWPALSPALPPRAPFRASVIIVALTASTYNPDRVAALAAGCNDYLTKPVKHAWLEKKIIEWGSMQYILLSGFPSDNWDRWREERRLDAAIVAAGPGASQQVARDIRRGFTSVPDEKARKLASKLHISRPPRSDRSSPVPSSHVPDRVTPGQPLPRPPVAPLGSRQGSASTTSAERGSETGTDSSGSSIRLNAGVQLGRLGLTAEHVDLVAPSTSSIVSSPALATSGFDTTIDGSPHPSPSTGLSTAEVESAFTSAANPQPMPTSQSENTPGLWVPSPPSQSVSTEDVDNLIHDNQVTKEVLSGSAVEDLAQQ
ncbi:Two-component response regulator SSK1p [Tilletia horrida]|uniref:Two-component response regulator SSK1p n=1 Tax=Tilletia horrida TaxID=155126 RepID=A0AAN6GQ06_9BASI|nr:Two-component response regulator SSK1p [Tilletia horrida]KAK0554643.1 Two-component response regulator SSK1p [Tilletia horrida]KAK0563265.1 Two-component response regulator SSK1p [Tilletia horrida]